MKKTLNIGCGTQNRVAGEVGFDINPDCKPDVCGNVDNLPFKDESFQTVKASHVLEHLDNIAGVMDECWRVLKQNGRFQIAVPKFPHETAIADPTHKRFFVPMTFHYFINEGALPGLKHIWEMGNIGATDKEIYCVLRKT